MNLTPLGFCWDWVRGVGSECRSVDWATGIVMVGREGGETSRFALTGLAPGTWVSVGGTPVVISLQSVAWLWLFSKAFCPVAGTLFPLLKKDVMAFGIRNDLLLDHGLGLCYAFVVLRAVVFSPMTADGFIFLLSSVVSLA